MATHRYKNTVAHRALCEALAEARESTGLSQRQLSARLERPAHFVGRIERGERMLSAVELIAYCETMGIASEKVLAGVSRRLKLTRNPFRQS